MSVETNKAIMHRLYGEINSGSLSALDELVDSNIVDHSAPPDQSPGLRGSKQLYTSLRTAFPDLQFNVEDMIGEGDEVVTRVTMSGTHKGDFQGLAPTGKKVRVEGINISRISGGKIVESWVRRDQIALMQQLGALPPSK